MVIVEQNPLMRLPWPHPASWWRNHRQVVQLNNVSSG
jgi:hypothetical protein